MNAANLDIELLSLLTIIGHGTRYLFKNGLNFFVFDMDVLFYVTAIYLRQKEAHSDSQCILCNDLS